MTHRTSTRFVALALIASTTACAVGPNHEAPEIKTPEAHRGEDKASPESLADLPWWEVYDDPALFSLIKEATEKSYDLRLALARVEVARQAHRAAVWALAPTLGVQGGVGDAVGTSQVPGIYPPQAAEGNFGLSGFASWEPDVWGRLRRIREGALREMEATDEDRRGVYIALVGDVAEFYFALSRVDAQKLYAQRAVDTRRETLTLFETRSGGGVGSELEVARARASLEAADAAVAALDLELAQNENALSFLLARMPGALPRRTVLDALDAPPNVPAGLPSTLLTRRPDIRAAEKRLLAANAQIGAEMADFFPKFELTGYLGVASPDLSVADSVRGGAALFNWTLPFLGGERVRAEYDAAIASWKGATAYYERTAVNAFREVADALAAIQTLAKRRASLAKQTSALEAAERLAVDRYRGGVANYLDVLTTQEQLLVVQLSLADVKSKELVAVSRLYRVLGGGWPIPDEEDGDKKGREKDGESSDSKPARSKPAN